MSILSKLQALLTAANTKTGQSDTTLTDAVQTLVDGYGQGGSDTPTIGVLTTINITEPVETISFTLPQLAQEYGKIWLACNGLTLSIENDYIYFAVVSGNTIPDDNSGWLRTTSYSGQAVCVFGSPKSVNGVTLKGYTGSWYSSAGTNKLKEVSYAPSVLKGRLYTGGNTFTAGSITIYGRIS